MPPITCHILDTARGKPASDVVVAIYRLADLPPKNALSEELAINEQSRPFALAKTNNDGRVPEWVFRPDADLTSLGVDGQQWDTVVPGVYRIRFQTGRYLSNLAHEENNNSLSTRTFFPFVDVVFTVDDPADAHYHIPLLLSGYSYTTYRGS